MGTAKVAITLDGNVLKRLDRRARECAKLDPEFEKRMAEEGIAGDIEFPDEEVTE